MIYYFVWFANRIGKNAYFELVVIRTAGMINVQLTVLEDCNS